MNKIKLIIALNALLLVHLGVAAQDDIVTIDGIYAERDAIASDGKMTTKNFRIDEGVIKDNDVIAFDIPGFGEFLERSHIPLDQVVLSIDGISIQEFPAYIENVESGVVRFQFSSDELSADHRTLIFNKHGNETKLLRLGISAGEKLSLNFSPKAQFYFQSIRKWKTASIILVCFFVSTFITMIVLFPSVLKDSLPIQLKTDFANYLSEQYRTGFSTSEQTKTPSFIQSADQTEPPEWLNVKNLSFSFSKTQFAFWTLIIIGSYIYLALRTEDANPLNTTALILLGMSSATTVAGSLINKSQGDSASSDKTSLLANSDDAAVPDERLKAEENRLRTYLKSKLSRSNFITDILSDNQGINIQRLQSFAINIVYGIIFILSVVLDYTMPTFGDTELLLLGVSDGTYAFLKTNENK